MDVHYTPKALKRLEQQLAEIKGPGAQRLTESIAKAVTDGNTYDRTMGRDRYGAPVARLKSKRKGIYAGKTGPPLAPDGAGSQVVRDFTAVARRRGGYWEVLAGWRGVVSRSGYPFLPAHDSGWGNNPRRPIFGVSPRTWVEIRRLLKEWKAGLFRRTGYRG